jgi:hypothetical protein
MRGAGISSWVQRMWDDGETRAVRGGYVGTEIHAQGGIARGMCNVDDVVVSTSAME